MTATTGSAVPTGAAAARRPPGGVSAVYRWELVKLIAQVRTRLVLGVCVLAPFVFVAALAVQSNVPSDTLFGRWVHDSGLAIPLVMLGFAGLWALPAVTSVVAGDIFSAEDRHGTWRTILSRSRTRGEVFAGKTLAAMTYSVVATVVVALMSLLAGSVVVGTDPLVDLSGRLLPAGTVAGLILVSWATVLPTVIGFTAVGLLVSAASRNGAVGIAVPIVIGLGLQLVALADLPPVVRDLLLTTGFTTWHGLFVTPAFHGPLVIGFVVAAVHTAVTLAVAYLLIRRRDMTEG